MNTTRCEWVLIGLAVCATLAAAAVGGLATESTAASASDTRCADERSAAEAECDSRLIVVEDESAEAAFARTPCGWRWEGRPEFGCTSSRCAFVGEIVSAACDDDAPEGAAESLDVGKRTLAEDIAAYHHGETTP